MPEKCANPPYFLVVEQGAADPLLFIHIYSLSIFRFKVYGHAYGPEYVPVYGPQYVPVYGPEYGPVYMDLNELNTRVCCH